MTKLQTEINRRRKAEKQLAKLIESDRQKTEFINVLAHEIRNPLFPIVNSAHLLQSLCPDASPELIRVRDMIDRQAKYMSQLLNNLLDVAKIDRGKLRLKKEPCNLNALVRNIIETIDASDGGRGHTITLQSGADLFVQGDPQRLEQIFINIIGNAVKYTEPGGKIDISVTPSQGYAEVRVQDNGPGIPPENLPDLFQLFAQAPSPVETSKGGLGIGLALSLDLAKMHGGDITASSEGPGKGSTFTLRLPLLIQEPKGQKIDPIKRKEKRIPARQVAIVVVDDNEDAAESFGLILRTLGQTSKIVYDGISAIQTIQHSNPEIVMLDIGLPGLDGYAVCKKIREEGYKGLVIAVTGYGTEADRRKSKSAGFDRHMVKPLQVDELEKILFSVESQGTGGNP